LKKKKQGENSNKTKQVTLPVAIEQTQPYLSSSKRAQEITNALLYFIAKEMMPFNIVEQPGFRKLLSKLDNRYNIPFRKYFAKTGIPDLYTDTTRRIAESRVLNITLLQQICGLRVRWNLTLLSPSTI